MLFRSRALVEAQMGRGDEGRGSFPPCTHTLILPPTGRRHSHSPRPSQTDTQLPVSGRHYYIQTGHYQSVCEYFHCAPSLARPFPFPFSLFFFPPSVRPLDPFFSIDKYRKDHQLCRVVDVETHITSVSQLPELLSSSSPSSSSTVRTRDLHRHTPTPSAVGYS